MARQPIIRTLALVSLFYICNPFLSAAGGVRIREERPVHLRSSNLAPLNVMPSASGPGSSGSAQAGPERISELAGGKRTILFADDDEPFQKMIGNALNALGFNVVKAANGTHALSLYKERPDNFDLILSDYLMPPGLNGLEFCRGVREFDEERKRSTAIPFGVMSAIISWHAQEVDRVHEELRRLGVPRVLVKTGNVQQLKKYIDELWEGSKGK